MALTRQWRCSFPGVDSPNTVATLLAAGLESRAFAALLCALCEEVNVLSSCLGLRFDASDAAAARNDVLSLLLNMADECMWDVEHILDTFEGWRGLPQRLSIHAHRCFAGRTYLLDFITSQLQMCRMEHADSGNVAAAATSDPLLVELTDLAGHLGVLQQVFGSGVAVDQAAVAMVPHVARVLAQPAAFPRLLSADAFAPASLPELRSMNESMRSHYATRKQVMLHRLAVTLKAVSWSKRADQSGGGGDSVADIVARRLAAVGRAECHLSVWDAALADATLLRIERVTDGAAKQTCAARAFVLGGTAPDRGGRVGEGRTASKMPVFKARVAGDAAVKTARVGYAPQRGGGGGERKQKKKTGGNRVKGAWAEGDKKRSLSPSRAAADASPGSVDAPAPPASSGGGGRGGRGAATNRGGGSGSGGGGRNPKKNRGPRN